MKSETTMNLTKSELEHIKKALELYFFTKRACDSKIDKTLLELTHRKIPSELRIMNGYNEENDPAGIGF